jgi:IS5 family transposase
MGQVLHGSPHDGHTLGPGIADLEKLTSVPARRIHGDKGYRGNNYPTGSRSGSGWSCHQSHPPRDAAARRRQAVIGHLKDDQRTRRNHLTGRDGDLINAVLVAVG